MGRGMPDRRLSIARGLVTLIAAFLAVGPLVADLNETHLLNPLWSPHARLHTAWLLGTNALISLVALWTLWGRNAARDVAGLRLSAALVGAILAGFFIAAVTQSAYGGAFTDANGVPLTVGPLDANLAGFSFCAVVVGTALFITRKRVD